MQSNQYVWNKNFLAEPFQVWLLYNSTPVWSSWCNFNCGKSHIVQWTQIWLWDGKNCIVYIHCREEGCITDTDISRAEGNLKVGGDVQPNTSRFEAVYGHSLIINPSLGMYQEIHPCRVSSTYSDKINTSLPMMREWYLPDSKVYVWNIIQRSFRIRTGPVHLCLYFIECIFGASFHLPWTERIQWKRWNNPSQLVLMQKKSFALHGPFRHFVNYICGNSIHRFHISECHTNL